MTKKTNELDLIPTRWDDNGKTTGYAVTRQPSRDELAPLAKRAESVTTGNPVQKAQGFALKTSILAGVVGFAMWIIARMFAGYPLFSLGALLFLVGGFLVVWLGAFVLDVFISAEGIDLFNSASYWRFMRREQNERHNREN